MILLFALVASLSYSNGAGIPGYPRGRTFPDYYNRYPVRNFGFPGRGPVMPQTTPPPAPASKPISDEDGYLSSEFGVRLPPRECVISNDQFIQHVVNMDWIAPYVIDNDSPLNPGISYKFNVMWTEVNSTFIRRRGSSWYEEMCDYLDAEFMLIGGDKAIYGASGGGDSFAISGRADYFVSFDPERYVIFYICYDADKSREGRCPNTEIFLLVKDQRERPIEGDGIRRGDIVLNDVHWLLIEETFKNCLGQQFVDDTDPQITWLWEKEDCVKPGSSQFDDAING